MNTSGPASGRRPRKGKKGKRGLWRPSRLQERYLETAYEFALRGKPLVQQEIAAACDIAKNRPSKWNRQPEFREAVTRALRTAQGPLMEAVHVSQMRLAMTSLPHYQTQLRRLGQEAPASAGPADGSAPVDPAAQLGGVHIHVHGIPERQPFSALPPPLELPAAPSGAPVPPAK